MKVRMEQEILQENAHQAEENRRLFRRILTVNLIGSPGCGKTTLLEKTLEALAGEFRMAVIEGDIYTTKDAQRIQDRGVPVVQINTAGGCHLSAEITAKAASDLNLANLDILFIENVGNLVCPAKFDLGEDCKAAVLSVAEGDDKPSKYPLLFQKSGIVILNKCDLLPYTNFNMETAIRDIRGLNPDVPILQTAAFRGDGLARWFDWLRGEAKEKRK